MRPYLSIITLLFCLFCGSASAEDYFITDIQGNYESFYAFAPSSIANLGEGVKRAELIVVDIDRVEVDEGVFATIGSLGVVVIEVNCHSTPRQFKEISDYIQFSKSEQPIDKTALNPYKNWAPLPAGSALEAHANFVCQWPVVPPDAIRISADSKWNFVDQVVETVRRLLDK